MRAEFHSSIPSELASVLPLGDFVLVRREPDAEQSNVILDPQWKKNPDPKPRRGTVIAVGPGDKIVVQSCKICSREERRIVAWDTSGLALHKSLGNCKHCGYDNWHVARIERAVMNVEVGDLILYQRAPANDVVIDGQAYVLLHEFQHIVAVLEHEEAIQAAA